ncbi:MAG: T9SS type A sorting domain-containing protein, partial [Crocinitomicaceae bacterium]|nr:T9SS type A sorting domain-containing protein [Crocinitomicaceae bacterium]
TVVSSVTSGTYDAFVTSVGTPTQNITWDITGTSEYFDIDYSTDGGTTWKRIVNDYRQTGLTGNYDWQVPDATTTQALIRVTDASNGVIVDQSDATFTINPADPLILVDSPNGGETFYQGESHIIEWRTTEFNVNNVQIEFSRDLGTTWELIAANYPNSGTYNWTVPVNITEAYPNCKVRVSKFDDLSVFDENDALFEIRPGIILESPNTNLSNWNGCTQSSITWYAGSSSNYTIELSTDNGSTWSTIESSYTDGAFFVNYPWDVPNANSTECQVRVTDNANSLFTDVSEVNFTILPSIEITSPNAGGNYIGGTVMPVTWADTNSSDFYNIDYSIDNGITWINVVTNHNTTVGLYNWTLPLISEPNVLLRVTDFVDNCKSDITDVSFSIALSPVITVVTPNGGETLAGCTPYNITWTDTGSSGNVNIKYSIDGGITWGIVVNNTPSAPLSYSWNTPNQLSSNCVIRVEDVLNLNTNYDHSDNVFSIDTSFTAVIASGGITEVCAGDNVTLTSNSPTGNYWYPNGETTSSIVVTNPGAYTLEVNNAGCISTSDDYILTVNPVPSVPVVTLNGPTTFCADESITLSSSSATGNYWLPNGETTSSITVNTSGTYSVVVTENSCSSTSATVVITVNPLPNAPVVTSNSIVPFGGTLTLFTDFGAGLTYDWVGPNGFGSTLQNPTVPNVTAADDGIYILNTVMNGCSSPYTYHTVGIGAPAQTINVSGNLATEIGAPIKLATADATDGGTTFTTLSDVAGDFNLDVGQFSTYDLIPSKDNDNVITNGISTLDLILIQSHILGVTPLSSPYKILAADVNGSSSVTTFDMVLIRQLILGVTTTYPNGQKWIFVDDAYNFPDPLVPFNYPNDITISSGVDLLAQDFVGIKLGDVSLDWDAVVAFDEPEDITFFSESDTVDLDEEFIFPVLVDEFSDVLGVQFTMEWPTQYFEYLEVAGNNYGINFSEHLVSNGYLTGSWFDPNVDPMTLSSGDTLFMLKFKVINSFGTEKISVNSEVTRAEGYDPQYGTLTLTDGFNNIVFRSPLGVEEQDQLTGFEVYPNPSNGVVNIDFVATQDDITTLELIDAHGKLIKVYDIEQKSGLNTVTIDLSSEIVGISDGQVVFLVLEQNGVQYIRKITLY